MNKKLIYWLQTAWLVFMGGFMFSLSRIISESYWISIPLFLLMWVVTSLIGVGLLSLCDPDYRVCAKYGIKMENLPIYRKAFEELVAAEERGEDTQGIVDRLPDKNEWQKYLIYEIEKGLK